MNGTAPRDSYVRTTIENDAIAIWQAGVDAVQPENLISKALSVEAAHLVVGTHRLRLDAIDRIVIVGGGKAVDPMASAAFAVLEGHSLRLSGWINAIEQPFGQPPPALGPLHRHVARTPGVNEPTSAAVHGTEQILKLVGQLGPRDVCLCLLSGGGSALLAAPPAGVTLDDKLDVIRRLSADGANIQQLNTVRRCLSRVKGGALALQCGAGHLFTLVISDVLGDAIETIASGPTAIGSADPQAAMRVLSEFASDHWQPPTAVLEHLQAEIAKQVAARANEAPSVTKPDHIHHILLANIHTAIDGAADEAASRGYRVRKLPVERDQPDANTAGAALADELLAIRSGQPTCIISGGEPTVTLAEESVRGKGGRNGQLALAALRRLAQRETVPRESSAVGDFAVVSAGTDGEDGPTDAAGAIFGAALLAEADQDFEAIERCLSTNDAYSFFDSRGALLKTGPTGTNVCDLRVLVRVGC